MPFVFSSVAVPVRVDVEKSYCATPPLLLRPIANKYPRTHNDWFSSTPLVPANRCARISVTSARAAPDHVHVESSSVYYTSTQKRPFPFVHVVVVAYHTAPERGDGGGFARVMTRLRNERKRTEARVCSCMCVYTCIERGVESAHVRNSETRKLPDGFSRNRRRRFSPVVCDSFFSDPTIVTITNA